MRGVLLERYGPPEVGLRLAELPTPEPAEGQVRIRVRAAALNAYDWHLYRGDPFLARMAFGLRRPRPRVVGIDAAGEVEAIGAGVSAFVVGDRVAGVVDTGTFAEQIVADAGLLAAIPDGMDVVTAAALPGAGLTALQGLRGAGIREGMRVLVIGASGGVGHYAVQLARALGAARVVAVTSGRNARMLADLGVDRVIDYTRERVTDAGERFDLVFDTVGTTSLRRLTRVMERDAVYAPAGGVGGGWLLGPAWAIYSSIPASWFLPQRVTPVSSTPTGAETADLFALAASGAVRPVIERVHPLEEYAQALAHLESKRVAGKLVLELG